VKLNENKIEPFISLRDEALFNETSNYFSLGVQLGLDFFTFCIFDQYKKKILFIETYHLPDEKDMLNCCVHLQKIVLADTLFRSDFKNVIISYVNQKSTLIPIPLYSEQHKKDYFKINHALEKDMMLLTDKIQILEAINIYAIPQTVETSILKLFPLVKSNHFSSGLIESSLIKYRNQNKKIAIVHVQFSTFEILIVNGKNLNFYNSFMIKTPEDFVYYILFVFEQLKINLNTIELVLCGQIIRNSELYALLYTHVKNVRFEERDDSFNYSYVFEEIPRHFYHNLFYQFKCVL
jgi:hypothetical protein